MKIDVSETLKEESPERTRSEAKITVGARALVKHSERGIEVYY